MFFAAFSSLAFGQNDFTITAQLQQSVVEPGLPASGSINLQPLTGQAGTPVALTCAVTSTQTTQYLPTCAVSPTTATPPAEASLTVNTLAATAAGLYTITITGTSGTFTHSAALNLNVVPETADYTIAVTKTIDPTSVAAGNGAQATITVTPIGNYTNHQITLFCLSVTPVVAASPVCSFNPVPVPVMGSTAPTSVLTITTFGTATGGVTKLRNSRTFYALGLALPGLALMAACSRGKRRRRILGLLLLSTIAGGLLVMPACSSSTTTGTTAPNGGVTPNNTYTFTLSAVDETGAAPSNTTSDQATVTLTVNTP
jgi:hypothetical protein